MLSTHFKKAHEPSARNLRILDLYSRQAADFVERCRSEEALGRSEERYRLLIENAREYAILMLDPKGNITTWNTGAERIFGYSEAEIIGRPAAILFTEEDRDWGALENEMRIAATGEHAADERWHLRKDGTRFWASGVMEALDAEGNTVHGFVKVLRDNTERKHAEQQLLANERHLVVTNEALSTANASLQQFAYAASHDLREPLRTITSYIRILIDAGQRGRKDDAEKAARFITEAASRMSNLLTDLLNYTQLSVSEKEVTLEPVDLSAVVDDVIKNLGSTIEQSGALIERDSLPIVCGQEANFVQLFQNLIANAIKYRSDRPPVIRISAEKLGDEWLLSISDNGIGIDAQYYDQIFGVFKRLHGSKIPGTGIGLAICRRVVERLGGRIWVESEVDKGSTFKMTIPASGASAIASLAG